MSNLKEENNSIYLTDIIFLIVKDLKIIIRVPFFFLLIAIIYVSFFTTTLYTSDAKIMSSKSTGNASNFSGLANQFGLSLPSSSNEVQWVYSEILKSRTLANAVLKRNFDTKKYGKTIPLSQILSGKVADNKLNNSKKSFLLNEQLRSMMRVSEDRNTSIFTLKVESFEPVFSADLLTAIIEELSFHQQKYNNERIKKTRIFLEGRISNVEVQLMNAEENLKLFRERNRRIENSPSLLLEQQRIEREALVLTSVYTTLKQQFETLKIEEVKESDYVLIIDSPSIPPFKSGPKKKFIVVLAFIIGLITSAVIIFYKKISSNLSKEDMTMINKIKKIFVKNIYAVFFLRS